MVGSSRGRPRARPAGAWLAVAVLLTAGVLLSSEARGQADRPKIGLALSGGGAKGAAHVGVLQVLEELRVPVDYIAGTSMGAIVGGLYASGIPADELERVLIETDWAYALDDNPNRRELHFRRKEDDARYLLDLELGLGRGGLKWPTGLISGQKLYFMLQSLTLPVAELESFDDLPIPFRCVATDIQTGEMVVLSEGNLASALRASMAIPSVFSPVELDGRLLVDGGVTRNLPVDIVREMGADIVIAVDVGEPMSAREIDSLVAVYSQLVNMQIRTNVEPQLELADLVLAPPVVDFGTMRFDRVAEIVELGYEDAMARADELQHYSLPDGEDRGPVLAQHADRSPVLLGEVRFEGNERVDDRIVRNRIRLQAGDPLDLEAIGRDLLQVHGLGDFESVTFDLEPTAEGPTLVLKLKEKPWGPNFLHFGFTFNTDFAGDTNVGLLTNLTATRLNALGAEWRTDLVIGNSPTLFSEFYQPLDFHGRWFVAPFVQIERLRGGLYTSGRRDAEIVRKKAVAGLDIGLQLSRFAEFRFGYEVGSGSLKVESGELDDEILEEIEDEDIDLGGLRLSLAYDYLDSATFPKRGGAAYFDGYASLTSAGADDEYTTWEGRISRFWSFGDNTVLVGLNGGWSPGNELPQYAVFTVGGFLSFSGYADNELRGQSYGVARLGYYRKTFGPIFVGGYVEGGNVWQTTEEAGFDSLIAAGTIFLGLDSRLGPVYVAYGHAEEGHNSAYIVFGRTF